MDFDPELIIRLVRAGVTVVNVSTEVSYPKNGISHFRMLAATLRLAWAYLRLLVDAPGRRVKSILGFQRRFGSSGSMWANFRMRESARRLRRRSDEFQRPVVVALPCAVRG